MRGFSSTIWGNEALDLTVGDFSSGTGRGGNGICDLSISDSSRTGRDTDALAGVLTEIKTSTKRILRFNLQIVYWSALFLLKEKDRYTGSKKMYLKML